MYILLLHYCDCTQELRAEVSINSHTVIPSSWEYRAQSHHYAVDLSTRNERARVWQIKNSLYIFIVLIGIHPNHIILLLNFVVLLISFLHLFSYSVIFHFYYTNAICTCDSCDKLKKTLFSLRSPSSSPFSRLASQSIGKYTFNLFEQSESILHMCKFREFTLQPRCRSDVFSVWRWRLRWL